MDNREDKEKESTTGIFGYLAVIFVVLMFFGNVLGFLRLLIEKGWSSAWSVLPVGGLLVFGILGIAYVMVIPWLTKQGYKGLANGMAWVAVILVGTVLITKLPSCSKPDTSAPTEVYFRK